MALVTTVGGASSVSYADADYADDYFINTSRETDWDQFEPADKDKLLLDAMMVMEPMAFMGGRAEPTQALEWPRRSSFYLGNHTDFIAGTNWTDKRGRKWDKDSIPAPIKQAQCEIALALGQNPTFFESQGGADISSVRTGRVTMTISGPNATRIFYRAMLLLGPFLAHNLQNAPRINRH